MSSHRLTDSTTQAPPAAVRYVTLGAITTSAPKAALLLALRGLRPQSSVRLRRGNTNAGETLYRVELRADELRDAHTIDAWLRIKSALVAAFPADKPHAVKVIET